MENSEQGKLPKGAATAALVMVLAGLPPMLDSTIVNIALNNLVKIFSTDMSVIQWAVTGYVLALGIAVPFSGWLIQRIDGKKLYMGALGLFVISSLLSGISWNVGSLIVFRLLQGFSAGIMIPTTSTLAVRIAGGQQNLGKLMSLVSIPTVFAPVVGPVVGGLIMQYLPWRWMFFINLPLGVLGLLLLQWKFPNFEADDRTAKLDLPGVLFLALTSGSLIFGTTEVVKANDRNLGITFLVIGAAAFIAYIVYAFKKKSKAVISLDMFRSKNFSAAFICLFLAGFAINGPMLLFPMLFQNVRGLSIITSALWLIPQGLGMLIIRPMVGNMTDKIGAKYVVLPSILLTLIGTIPFAFFGADTLQWFIWLTLLVRGMGVGGFTIPIMSASYVGLDKRQVPSASVATRIIQNIGSAFGSALLATIVSSILAKQIQNTAGAYHAGFITSIIFMSLGIIPTFFLASKVSLQKKT